jgi:hypothetical protein
VSIIEELLGRNSSGSGIESRDYSCGDPPSRLRDTPLSSKVGTDFAKAGRAGNRNRTSGSVARNPDHYTSKVAVKPI